MTRITRQERIMEADLDNVQRVEAHLAAIPERPAWLTIWAIPGKAGHDGIVGSLPSESNDGIDWQTVQKNAEPIADLVLPDISYDESERIAKLCRIHRQQAKRLILIRLRLKADA